MQVPPPALSVPVDEEVRPRSRTSSLHSSSPRVDSPRQLAPSAPSLSIPPLTFVSPCSSPCSSPRSPLTASSPHNEHDEEQLQEQLIEAIYANITAMTGPIGYANVLADPTPAENMYANVEKAPATSNTATASVLPAVAFWSGSERKVEPFVPTSVLSKHGATSPRAGKPIFAPPFTPSDIDALERLPSGSLEFGTHPHVGRQPAQRSLQAPVCPMSIRRNAHVMLLRNSRGSQAINHCVHCSLRLPAAEIGWYCDLHPQQWICLSCAPESSVQRMLLPEHAEKLASIVTEPTARKVWTEMLLSATLVTISDKVFGNCRDSHSHQNCSLCRRQISDVIHWHACETPLSEPFVTLLAPIICDECISHHLVNSKCSVSLVNLKRMLNRITKPHVTMKDGSTMLLDYAVECFAFLANTSNGVSTQQWEDMCLRFGPPDGVAFWMRIAWLSSQSWFFGRVKTLTAGELAEKSSPGSWLFRFSTSEKGGFAFTVTDKNGKVTHYRVSREWAADGKKSGEFILRMKPEEKRYATLGALLQGACKELKLRSPISASSIPGSIQSRWLTTKEARYDDRSARVQEVFVATPAAPSRVSWFSSVEQDVRQLLALYVDEDYTSSLDSIRLQEHSARLGLFQMIEIPATLEIIDSDKVYMERTTMTSRCIPATRPLFFVKFGAVTRFWFCQNALFWRKSKARRMAPSTRQTKELFTLVIQLHAGHLTAVNKETGECHWRHPLPSEARVTALRMDGWAEVSSDRFQYLINTRNGESLRRRKHATREDAFVAHQRARPIPAPKPRRSLSVTATLSKRATKR